MDHQEPNLNPVTIAQGPLMKMEILSGALEEAGIPSTIPDRTIKIIDPFVTGANSFDCRLQVPATYGENAIELIRELHEQVEESFREGLDVDGFDVEEISEEDLRLTELSKIGRRVCWSTLLWITQPLAIYYAIVYFSRIESVSKKPVGHKFVLASMVLLLALLVVWSLAVARFIAEA